MELYTFIYLIPMLLSAIFSLKAFSQKWPKPFKIFSVDLVFCVIFEAFALIWPYLIKYGWFNSYLVGYKPYNIWIYNFGMIAAESISLYFFYEVIRSQTIRKVILGAMIILIPLSFLNYFFFQGPHILNNYSLIAFKICNIILTLLCFIQIINDEQIFKLAKYSLTWILIGRFLYSLFTIIPFLNYDFLSEQYIKIGFLFFYAQDLVNIICYTLYLIAYLCKPHPTPPSTQSSYLVSS